MADNFSPDEPRPYSNEDADIFSFFNGNKSGINIAPGLTAYSGVLVVSRLFQLLDGRNIQLGRGVGTQIGTSALQKLGFYGVAPVVQASAITAPTGGATQDSQARTAINSIITALHNMGITA